MKTIRNLIGTIPPWCRTTISSVVLCLLFSACSHPADVPPIGHPIPAAASGGVITTRMDPAEILQISVAGDELRMTVRHGGGCRDHGYSLLPSGVFMESLPVQMSVQLAHDARGDLCRGIVGKDLVFDLSPIRRAYRDAYRSDTGVVVLRIWAPAASEPHPGLFRYEF